MQRQLIFEPCLPTSGTKVPDGNDWLHEIKYDGYRLIVQRACKFGLEGLVSKKATSRYRGGRSRDWIKVKNRKHPAMHRVKESFS